MVLHSKQADGRHWLTTVDTTPLQIWPVAANHCRAGHFLATLISAKLTTLESDIPEEMVLSRADVASVGSLADRYPELNSEAGEVRIRLVAMKGPSGHKDEQDQEQDAEEQFMTPQPPLDWTGNYDRWIVSSGRSLGVDVPVPSDESGYESAMASAVVELQHRLPSLRQRFLAGMGNLNLGFKVGLATQAGDKEYVWVRPTEWNEEDTVVCVLESEPHDCEGYELGQKLRVPVRDLVDYAIGSESAGLVEPGLTQQIAEDYGLVLP
jgi:uncharacterized protein YegJ (DUF2314 family)